MILKLALKNVLSRKSSFVIVLFMSFAVCLFCITNAVFDSTENGIQRTFKSSFTGDIIIRPQSEVQLSLFGDETPVTGELTSIPSLVPYSEIIKYLQSVEILSGFVPQIICMAALEYKKERLPVYTFGINAKDYLSMMESVHIVEGAPYDTGSKGVMLCDRIANQLKVKVGDTVQFTVADGPNIRIRAATVSAIYTYDVYHDIFERFVLLDADVVRSLLDLDSGAFIEDTSLDEDLVNLFDEDLDSLFDSSNDSGGIWNDYEEVDDDTSYAKENNIQLQNAISNTWNFIIINLNNGTDSNKAVRKLNHNFRKKGWPIKAVNWRYAAGNTALYLYWMRIILNIGIAIVLFAGFIIVNNTLVINILDRTQEIGTLRAIGTKKSFISLECMAETFIITLFSGLFGVILGKISCHFITKAHIILNNSFLVQLFGCEALVITVGAGNIIKMFMLVIALGIISWIYPVTHAIKVSPVKAMQGTK